MTRSEFISNHRIESALAERGITVHGSSAKCPFHDDKTASLSVDVEKQVWNCHAGCGGGSVIDLMARFAGQGVSDYLRDKKIVPDGHQATAKPQQLGQPKKVYTYRNAIGDEVYRVLRYEPKTFRQQRKVGDKWEFGMDGVERVLYRLPEVLAAQTVAIVEGERDAESLVRIGICGTCNVGGAGKWMDGYTESLKDKDVLIFGDNDEAGRKHVELVFDSIAGKVKTAKLIELPKEFKDVTDFAKSIGDPEKVREAVDALVSRAVPFVGGIRLPIFSMVELEERYAEFVNESAQNPIHLKKWLPSFRRLRSLVPGELVLLVGDTGTGKTALLSSMALAMRPIPTVMFQLELPLEMLFERHAAALTGASCEEIEKCYASGYSAGHKLLSNQYPGLFFCAEVRLTPEKIEEFIIKSELKIGERPRLILIDYAQLMKSRGKGKYEEMSNIAEDLKAVAKSTRTVIVLSSQVTRPEGKSPEIGLHDAKGSGSLENSAGLVLGAWRDEKEAGLLHLRVLKSTKGGAGLTIKCNFDGAMMKITERAFDPCET